MSIEKQPQTQDTLEWYEEFRVNLKEALKRDRYAENTITTITDTLIKCLGSERMDQRAMISLMRDLNRMKDEMHDRRVDEECPRRETNISINGGQTVMNSKVEAMNTVAVAEEGKVKALN